MPNSLKLSAASLRLPVIWKTLTSPVYALPIDIFRITAGALLLAYFLRTFFEANDFSSPDGLIDHALLQSIFWFTKIGFFQPGMTLFALKVIFLLACLFSLFVIAGYRVKLAAFLLYLIAISTYRWNFLVMYIDDSIMHLLVFWLLVLPVGKTLTVAGYLSNRASAWRSWKTIRVPGFALRCFYWNFALIYLVAGIWKWTSPMWLDGSAVYVVFKLPISYGHAFWGAEHLPFLRILNYAALVLEPIIPLMLILPKGHIAKYALLFAFLGLHFGSVATLDIPFANLACAFMPILIFREELMDYFLGEATDTRSAKVYNQIGFSGFTAALMVTLLTLSMVSSVTLPSWRGPSVTRNGLPVAPAKTEITGAKTETRISGTGHEGLGPVQTTFFGILWCIGIAQQYQLFNWIDHRNYKVRYSIREHAEGVPVRDIDPDRMFLPSTRGVLLQFYLHGITWARIPDDRREELRRSLLTRSAMRYCRIYRPRGKVSVYSSLERIETDGNVSSLKPALLMNFDCTGPVLEFSGTKLP